MPATEEVIVAQARKGFAIAIFVTAHDGAVISYHGPAIWQTWGNVPWLRVGILLLAGVGSFTLVDIWRGPLISVASGRTRRHSAKLSKSPPSLQN
jgi:hypothetical protein